jgi:hypothetical protein
MTAAKTQPTGREDIRAVRTPDIPRMREILATVKPLAAEYYRLTGKPLGVTGEVAEFVAAECLGLDLCDARTAGFDAIRQGSDGLIRIQIKGRAFGGDAKPGQRLGRIKTDAQCDIVLLVLLDNATLDPREMWEAPFSRGCCTTGRVRFKSTQRTWGTKRWRFQEVEKCSARLASETLAGKCHAPHPERN